MSSDVVLTSALRNTLISLQDTQRSSGNGEARVTSTDNSKTNTQNQTNSQTGESVFTPQSLNNRASDLGLLLDNVNQSVRTIETATASIDDIKPLVEEADTVVNAALDTLDDLEQVIATSAETGEPPPIKSFAAKLAAFSEQYSSLRQNIDEAVETADYKGKNLLKGDELSTSFSESSFNQLITNGIDLSANGLGLTEIDFENAGAIEQLADNIQDALTTISSYATVLAGDLEVIQERRDFTEQTINTLGVAAEDLSVSDYNEEGANLLALQTRLTLSQTQLSLATESQQSVLRHI